MLAKRPKHVNVVLTGRNAPQEIVDAADLVSEVQEIKHYSIPASEQEQAWNFKTHSSEQRIPLPLALL